MTNETQQVEISAGHTPGPWRTVERTGGTIRVDVVTDALPFAPSFVAGDVLPADGRLMASAPDLLEALEAVEWQFADDDEAEYRCSFCDASQADGHLESCKVAAAIRKARGGA